jgi:uncharacterized protein YbjT (DUF2867 family)
MNVLITGGTGFVGQSVVRSLHEAGHHVRVLVRRPNGLRAQRLAALYGVELRVGQLHDVETLGPVVAGVDAIIHLVGIISEVGSQTFENVHVVATRNLLDAARTAGVERYVHMSALGARPGAVSRYHQTKYAAEELVRGAGLNWTIFRPSLIYGPGDGFVNLFARMSRFSPVLPVIGSGRARFQPISVENVASCFVRALTEPRAATATFDLCGEEALTLGELLGAILRVTGRRRLRVRVPIVLAEVQAGLLEFFFPLLLRRAPPLNRDQVIMLEEGNVGDGEPARLLFGCTSPTFAEGIASFLGSGLKS